jgi:rhamnosyltransferase
MNKFLNNDSVIYAVVVTYFPDIIKLKKLIDILLSKTEQIIIVDNGSAADLVEFTDRFSSDVILVKLGENTGIAHAINIGIEKIFNLTDDPASGYIAIFDQDSLPEEDMIDNLLNAATILKKNGKKLAAVGANYLDERGNNTSPFVKLRKLRLVREKCEPGAMIPVDLLISSGSLTPMTVFKEIGLMKNELFIDYVDIEWSLRATSMGYALYGIVDAQMNHELGDDPEEIFGRKIPVHSPLRDYYHFRNAIYLIKKSYTPVAWKITDGYRLLMKYFVYSLLIKPRYQRWSQMNKGLWHGLIGRMGKEPEN